MSSMKRKWSDTTPYVSNKEASCVIASINKTSQKNMQELERDENVSFCTSEGSNLSCLDITTVPQLKAMEFSIPCELSYYVGKDVELKELVDLDLKQNLKNEEIVNICTNEGSTNSFLNNTAVLQEKEIEPFSGEFSDSEVRNLIESDPFLREVVDSFFMHEWKNEQNVNVCTNGGSTLSDVNNSQAKQM